MTISYFPIFSYQTENSENYSVEWPFEEIQFEKRYAQRISLGYKQRIWEVQFRLFSSFRDVSVWAPDTVYSVGDYITPESTVTDCVFLCIDPGTSGADSEEPDWADTQGEFVTDGGVTWAAFKDSQIEALKTFIDDRQGGAESFKVWMPMYGEWVTCVFPKDPIKMTPVKPGSFDVIDVPMRFVEDYSDAP
jgi:hypothetical protein